MYWVRAIGGLLYLTGAELCGVNIYKTWARRPARYETPVQSAPALTVTYDDPPAPKSRIGGHVVNLAHKIDVWEQAAWHRRWERLPLRFTVWTTIAVVVASLFEIIPTFLIRSNVPTIASVAPYTPLELEGRDIYIANGCYNCHSQMVRPIFAETKRYGEYSKPGEFVYDHPFQWGSRRIGPDLAREGGKQSHLWHVEHFRNPQQFTPKSIMPEYGFLLTQPIDFAGLQKKVDVMAMLGVPYGDAVSEGAAQRLAREQAQKIGREIIEQGGPKDLDDRQVVALIAYLQRIGTDITKPAPAPGITAEAKTAAVLLSGSGDADITAGDGSVP
jgi:cytochrome c oxidase cbb3-type subunit I/II